ncbi:MAG: ATP-binding cassette domain-containing protein [Gammaproteobacteria bacterium]|nr:ATP-binding cassette domain-containing protein [Gammaproteobacteria bacterium]
MNTRCRLQDIRIVNAVQGRRFCLRRAAALEIPNPDSPCDRKVPLTGISGAGKSTLLNALAAMAWPVQGSVTWTLPGVPVEHSSWTAKGSLVKANVLRLHRKHFGFVFQDSTLAPHLTIRDNLVYPQLLNGILPDKAEEEAKKLLVRVFPDRKPNGLLGGFQHEISGGERQRVALVQAMLNAPYVLFADEPAGSLDKKTRETVMNVLYGWVDEDPQRLLLWVTHHEEDKNMAKHHLVVETRASATESSLEKNSFFGWSNEF